MKYLPFHFVQGDFPKPPKLIRMKTPLAITWYFVLEREKKGF